MPRLLAVALAVVFIPGSPIYADAPFPVVATIQGVAGVRDGDGILFGDVEVRLQGIAAPEDRRGKVENGGKATTAAHERLALGKNVFCYLDGSTAGRSMRPVAVCYVNGLDLGGAMVRSGHARDCPAFSRGRYAMLEAKAHADGNDLSQIYFR